jgi:glycosyltransferase involved in cell wall biosynthesis
VRLFGFHDGAGGAYYRVLLAFDALRDLGGHEIDTNCGWDERCAASEVIVSQKLTQVHALPLWRRLAPGHKLVYELDDDLWSIDRLNLSAWYTHNAATIDAAEQAMMIANLVQVSTDPLAEKVRKFNPNVVILPNHIDGRLLQLKRPQRDKLTIGWAGGDSHIRDLAMIADPLRRVLRDNPQAEFHNIGTDFRRLMEVPGRFTQWKLAVWDYYTTIDFDIGLAPLAKTPFNESKSHIKALEYMALGIPVIASDLAPYNQLVRHGVNGFLVRQPHQWRSYLRQLINDPSMREEMGRNGKQTAAKWTIQEGWRLWEKAYSENQTKSRHDRNAERIGVATAGIRDGTS